MFDEILHIQNTMVKISIEDQSNLEHFSEKKFWPEKMLM